ncbi:hypothetical protein [Eisenbergiella tayi]|jgi:hypothetical protein|uniref:Uncharacterized protein n=1 Tax=Eisenbergiella tayi TaxID=1432052 RepID=A0A1E3A8G0_9FIRM|nr:hypothetical protein [Eisenbergiella tayi]CUP54446.1 Uncharacterised protein [Fusicatenibacter sp. 2789STDY5834925]ODM04496.1 hypothetical protein BEI61_05303 [Eisenbergiella tayi]ODR33190.1 hypothetical protein BEI60_26545 [Eisenbergiella tayi]ODR42035.1 hypothetical protein BEI62_07945 [Eisenbergiella tayi]ODR57356.1 hypothetical protein BEI64_19140 [Eisenbergiella tayi]
MAENRKRFTEDFTSRILEVRYTDLEKEKRLCLELLVLAKEECDLYGEVFALAYMGIIILRSPIWTGRENIS